jgi:hypothetical protein
LTAWGGAEGARRRAGSVDRREAGAEFHALARPGGVMCEPAAFRADHPRAERHEPREPSRAYSHLDPTSPSCGC